MGGKLGSWEPQVVGRRRTLLLFTKSKMHELFCSSVNFYVYPLHLYMHHLDQDTESFHLSGELLLSLQISFA